ncbi:PREDICTED: perilipin-2-like isoform X1 [Branchiostoma belcheri]|uniref:Perilipin-2-like isoform X1 n=1 Tax=Branchiostoma belcheri TaxID=7741 RepID=A0A6P4Z2H5_BRABE|nr:PREDICTED: perilipin-2-like isoform X1 [Branchiostoma belcheri]
MYRKHQQEIMAAETEDNIITRVGSLPLVSASVTQVTSIYSAGKERYPLVKYVGEMAEKTVMYAADTAKPVVDKLEPQIAVANSYAVAGLNKLEETVPIITKEPGVIVGDTKQAICSTVSATGERIMNNPVGRVVKSVSDTALATAESYVEYYLPPEKKALEEDEGKEKEGEGEEKAVVPAAEGTPTLTRVTSLTGKVRRRVYTRAMAKLKDVQVRSQEALSNLHFTVDLIQYAKENIDTAGDQVKERLTAAQEKLQATWGDLLAEEEGEVPQEERTVERRVVRVAGRLTGHLSDLAGKAVDTAHSVLPQSFQDQLHNVKQTVDTMYGEFREAKGFSDLPTELLEKSREQIQNLTGVVTAVTDYIITNTPIQWVVPARFVPAAPRAVSEGREEDKENEEQSQDGHQEEEEKLDHSLEKEEEPEMDPLD